jgi:sigma-B regulation protein RsbU (phosphoserine phosphatase)
VEVPLAGFKGNLQIGETVFLILLQIVMPGVCLLLGYWVVLARPMDPHAWLILILLSYPEAYAGVSTFNSFPGGWLVLRLAWHMTLEIIAPAALVWFGLLFPERSRIDTAAPWLKWLLFATVVVGEIYSLVSDYASWYDRTLYANREAMDSVASQMLNWLTVICIGLYWVAIFAKLRTASTSDARRRMRVLCAGSVIGLGSMLILWGFLPRIGLDPGQIHWLAYSSGALLAAFPFSLAYVVVVQRAMDVSILIRIGTRYALARTTVFLLQFVVILVLLFKVAIPLLRGNSEEALAIIVPVAVFLMILPLQFVKRTMADRARAWVDRRFFREEYNTERILGELAMQARSISDPGTLIRTISGRISEVLHVPNMAVMLRTGNVFSLQTEGGLQIGGPIFLAAESTPVQHLVRTSAPAVLYRDQPDEWFEEANAGEKRALTELNAEVLLPLAGRSRLMGVMVLGPKRSEEPYSPSDLELLASIGAQAGLRLEVNELAHSLADEAARHQRVQREVEIAREVQERLFPEIPTVPGLDLAGHCRPALGVGGDYYDVVPLEDGRLAIAIGDISGKGIAAALLMASLRASLRGLVDASSQDLAAIIRKLNRLIHESSTANRYATFFFAIYDPAAMILQYVNAGHNPPIILRGAEAIRLEASGPVIGLLKDVEYEEGALEMMPGDLFIGYTDGISEAMTVDDEEWGEDRMQAAAGEIADRGARGILQGIFAAADGFTAGAPQHDDMTLLVLRLACERVVC